MGNTITNNTFVRDFILEGSAISFAQAVGGKISLIYDWDTFHNCLIKFYRVSY